MCVNHCGSDTHKKNFTRANVMDVRLINHTANLSRRFAHDVHMADIFNKSKEMPQIEAIDCCILRGYRSDNINRTRRDAAAQCETKTNN